MVAALWWIQVVFFTSEPEKETFAILIFGSSFPPRIPQCFHTVIPHFPQVFQVFPQVKTVGSVLTVLLGIFPEEAPGVAKHLVKVKKRKQI